MTRFYILIRGFHDQAPCVAFFDERWRAECSLAEVLGLDQARPGELPYFVALADGNVALIEVSKDSPDLTPITRS